MKTRVRSFGQDVGDVRTASSAGGGTALTTTATFIPLPAGASAFYLTPRNFVTAVVAQIGLCPYATVLKTTDDEVTFTEYTTEAQDNDTATDVTLSSLGTAAQGDYFYVGAYRPFRGVEIDIDAANGTASVITAKYWTGGDWVDISATDGTASGGATFAVDGQITWTVPTAWAKKQIDRREMYWVRFQVSVALDSSTTFNSLFALAQSSSLFELLSGQPATINTPRGQFGFAAVEAKVNAGTGNLVVGVLYGDPNLDEVIIGSPASVSPSAADQFLAMTLSVGEKAGSASASQFASVAAKWVKVKAQYDNAGRVYIGGSAVTVKDGTTDTTTGYELSPGEETPWLPLSNLNALYLICNNAGDDVTYMVLA